MRIAPFLRGIVLVMFAATALADDAPLHVPRQGMRYLVALVNDTTRGDAPPEHVETDIERTVTASDGETARLENRMTGIRGAKFDHMTPSARGIYMAMMSGDNVIDTWHFLATRQEYVFWPGVPSETGTLPSIDTLLRIVVDTACDRAALASFEPLGTKPTVTAACTFVTTTQDREPQHQDGTMTLSYEGKGRTTTPAGTFDVQKLRVRVVLPTYSYEYQVMFSEALGISVHTDTMSEAHSGTMIVKTAGHTEVIRVY